VVVDCSTETPQGFLMAVQGRVDSPDDIEDFCGVLFDGGLPAEFSPVRCIQHEMRIHKATS